MSNEWKKRLGVVYSTDPGFEYHSEEGQAIHTPEPGKQDLRVMLDRKNRKGKTVTLVTGFAGKEDDLKELARKLKSKCGVGGSAKDNEIIIQGDHRDRIFEILRKDGYGVKKSGG